MTLKLVDTASVCYFYFNIWFWPFNRYKDFILFVDCNRLRHQIGLKFVRHLKIRIQLLEGYYFLHVEGWYHLYISKDLDQLLIIFLLRSPILFVRQKKYLAWIIREFYPVSGPPPEILWPVPLMSILSSILTKEWTSTYI